MCSIMPNPNPKWFLKTNLNGEKKKKSKFWFMKTSAWTSKTGREQNRGENRGKNRDKLKERQMTS